MAGAVDFARAYAVHPILSAGAKEQGLLKALRFQIAQEIVVGSDAALARVQTAVPFVENKCERPPPAMLEKQVPAKLVVIFLLRADIEHDVGDRKQVVKLLTVGEVVAVEVRRIDDDFLLERWPVVDHELAMLECRVQFVRLERLMVVDDRIARGGPRERG